MDKERGLETPTQIIEELIRLHRLELEGKNTSKLQAILWDKLMPLIDESFSFRDLTKNEP